MYCLGQGDSLGQGSFTRIYKGYKTEIRDGEKHAAEVFLKELDVAHKACWEVGFLNLIFIQNAYCDLL